MAVEPSILVAGAYPNRTILYRLFWNPVGGAGAVLSYVLPFALTAPTATEFGMPRMLVNNNKLYVTPGDPLAGVPVWSADFTQDNLSPGVGPVWTNMCTLPVGISMGATGRGPGRVDHIEQLWGNLGLTNLVSGAVGAPSLPTAATNAPTGVIDLTTGTLKYSIDPPPSRNYYPGSGQAPNGQYIPGVPSITVYFGTDFLPVTINGADYMAIFYFENPEASDGIGGAFYLVDIHTGAIVTSVSPIWTFPATQQITIPFFISTCKTPGQMSFDGANVYVSANFQAGTISAVSYRLTQINCLTGAVTDLISTSGAFDDNVNGIDADITKTWIDFNTKLLYCAQRNGQHLIYALPGSSGLGAGSLLLVEASDLFGDDLDFPDTAPPNQQYGYANTQYGWYFDYGPFPIEPPFTNFPRTISRVDLTTFTVIDNIKFTEGWGVQNTVADAFNWAFLDCTIDGIVSMCVCTDTTLEFR